MKNNTPKHLLGMAGIYQILNTANGKCYIGSTKKLLYRYSQHKRELESNKHHNGHLNRAYNQYGADVFEFNLLEVVNIVNQPSTLLMEIENRYIIQFNSIEPSRGYNNLMAIPSCYGTKHSEESKSRRKGRVISPEVRLKLGVRGEKHFGTSLSNDVVREIKIMIAKGCRPVDIANHLNLTTNIVSHIKKGKTWVFVEITQKEIDNYIVPSNFKCSYNYQNPNSPNVKQMDNQQVKLVKYLLSNGERIVNIAEYFGVNWGTIRSIKSGRAHKSIQLSNEERELFKSTISDNLLGYAKESVKVRYYDNHSKTVCRGEKHPSSKLDSSRVLEIKALLENGFTCVQIAERYRVTPDSISKIRHGKNWSHVTGFLNPRKAQNKANTEV